MAGFLADVTVAVHIISLLYIGLGGFLVWWWPKTIFVHVFFAAWGVLVNVFPWPCPLTALENFFRHQQGLGDLPGGFNEYYLYDTLFPKSILPVVAVVAIAILLFSYIGAYQRWRHRHHDGQHHGDAPAHRVRMG